MSYNVLRQFVGAGGGVGVLVMLTFGGGGGGVLCKIESLQILDLGRLAGML